MDSVLTRVNIANASSAIDTYKTKCDGIYEDLNGILTSLRASNWQGEGADGCKEFFDTTVTKSLKEGLESYTKAMKDILMQVEEMLIGTVDPQLGADNRSPGGTPVE